MVSVAEADKETLLNFLGDQLLPFISPNEDTPTDGNLMGPTRDGVKPGQGQGRGQQG